MSNKQTTEEPQWRIERREWDAWIQTPVGAAFQRFESAHSRYWQQDGNERISGKRLRELDEASSDARNALIAEIKKLQESMNV